MTGQPILFQEMYYQGNVSLPESLQVEQSIFKGPKNGQNSSFMEHTPAEKS
jgi:hypothetical protein